MHDLKYEWVNGEQYQERIYSFLKEIDEIMIPSLSSRVCIFEYASKLARLAESLYIFDGKGDIASCSVYCNSKVAFISSIAVKKEFLERGIGTLLITEVKKYVRTKGCEEIHLEVYAQNSVALSFYIKNGFIIFAENGDIKTMRYLFKTKEIEGT